MSILLTLAASIFLLFYIYLEHHSSHFFGRKSYLMRKVLMAFLIPLAANLYEFQFIHFFKPTLGLYLLSAITFVFFVDHIKIFFNKNYPLIDLPGGLDYFRYYPPRTAGDMSTMYVMFGVLFLMPLIAKFIHGV